MGIGFVSHICGRYGVLLKVRYSFPIFGYILWKVKSAIGWLHLRKVWFPGKVMYSHLAFDYIM